MKLYPLLTLQLSKQDFNEQNIASPRLHHSAHTMLLTDLPQTTLAQIAASVSRGDICIHSPFPFPERPPHRENDDLCKYSRLPFQAICGVHNWRLLNPLRLTCKAFNEACKLAVGGLKDIEFSKNEQVPVANSSQSINQKFVMPLKAALSLQCLAELHITTSLEMSLELSIGMLIERVPTLKCLTISSRRRDDRINISMFPASMTLEMLELRGESSEMIEYFFSYPYKNLHTLKICSQGNPPKIPQCILKTLKELHWGTPHLADTRKLLQELVHAPLLKKLVLERNHIDALVAPPPECRFPKVIDLQVCSLGANTYARDFLKLISNGSFPALQRMKAFATLRYAGVVGLKLKIEEGRLRKVNTTVDIKLNKEVGLLLEHLQFDKKYEPELQIFGFIGICSMRYLHKLTELITLKVQSATVEHIFMLSKLTNLKTVHMCQCEFKLKEVLYMQDNPNMFEEFLIVQGIVVEENYDGKAYKLERLQLGRSVEKDKSNKQEMERGT